MSNVFLKLFPVVTILLCCSFSLSVSATDPLKSQDNYRKAAFKLRDDVTKTAKLKMKSWRRPGILHSDWIENTYGKSIDLDGKELFPEVDYIEMTEFMPRLFALNNYNTHTQGVIRRDGTIIVPFRYTYVDSSDDVRGILKGIVGDKVNGKIDFWTIDGAYLFTVEKLGYSIEDHEKIDCRYDFDKNFIKASYSINENGKKKVVSRFFLADGTEVMDPIVSDWGTGIYFFPKIEVINADKTTEVVFPNAKAKRPQLSLCNREEAEKQARLEFTNNVWVKKGIESYSQGNYKKALEYLHYFCDFDQLGTIGVYNTTELFLCSIMMRCYYELGDYAPIINGRGDKFVPWFTLVPNFRKDEAKLLQYAPSVRSEVIRLIDVCHEIYDASVAAHQQRIIRQQQNAELWGQVFKSVNRSISQTVQSMNRSSSSSNVIVSSSTNSNVSSSSSYSSHNRNSSSSESDNTKLSERHEKCGVCDGTGVCTYCKGTGKGVRLGMDSTCGACEGHPKCTACKGRGYKIHYN